MIVSSTDQQDWALCLWREARGEGFAGMRAVAWVIRNRSIAWAKSIHDVLFDKNQFTSMTGSTKPADGDAQWKEAQQIVAALMHGVDASDPTGGALYYANLATATSGWFFEKIVESALHQRTAVIGHHTFFR
jgi:N-acetylmuramoyl-L-alanine amidase